MSAPPPPPRDYCVVAAIPILKDASAYLAKPISFKSEALNIIEIVELMLEQAKRTLGVQSEDSNNQPLPRIRD